MMNEPKILRPKKDNFVQMSLEIGGETKTFTPSTRLVVSEEVITDGIRHHMLVMDPTDKDLVAFYRVETAKLEDEIETLEEEIETLGETITGLEAEIVILEQTIHDLENP
jgi:predicted RNase H-like nuclease (RuvC/YqgF family)